VQEGRRTEDRPRTVREEPDRKNPAWRGVEHNDFGIDDFLKFCRVLDTEPLVVVNSGLGGVGSAAEELLYPSEMEYY